MAEKKKKTLAEQIIDGTYKDPVEKLQEKHKQNKLNQMNGSAIKSNTSISLNQSSSANQNNASLWDKIKNKAVEFGAIKENTELKQTANATNFMYKTQIANNEYKQKKEEQNNKLVSQNSDMWNQVQNIASQLQNSSAMSVNQNKTSSNKTYNRNNVDSNNNSLKNNQVQLANKNETENAKRVDTVAYSNTKSNAENGNVFNYIKDKAKLGVESFGDNILNLYTTDMIKNNQKAQKLNNILGDDSKDEEIKKTNANLNILTNNTDYQAKKSGIQLGETDFSKKVKTLGNASESVGAMVPAIATSFINPNLGLATTGISASGSAMKQALDDGATAEQAQKVGVLKGGVEVATEKLFGGVKFFGKGSLDNLFSSKVLDKVSLKVGKFAIKEGYDITGEVVEENLSNLAGYGIDKLILNKDLPSFKEMMADADDTTKTTVLSTIMLKALGVPTNMLNKNEKTEKLTSMIQDIKPNNQETVKKNQQELPQTEINNNSQQVNQTNNKMAQNQISSQTDNYTKSALENNIDVNNETVKTVKKALENRGIEGKFDSSLFQNNQQDALWKISTDEKGNTKREVIFNPNGDTNKTMQNITTHELWHDMQSQDVSKEISDWILKNNKTREGYEGSRKSLEDMYSQVYDKNSSNFKSLVDEEEVADTLAQRLGDQDFVKSLSAEKPNVFKRIHEWVIDKLNKVTKGSFEQLYWKDIENKFRQAYREDNSINQKNEIKYSIQVDSNGNQYVKIDTDQHIFEGKSPKEYTKIAKQYILNKFRENRNRF